MAHRSTKARTTRADETRAETSSRDHEVHDEWPDTWQAPSRLDAPEPLPGMRQKWIAKSLLGSETPDNVAKRQREGWRPRPLESIPTSFMGGQDGHRDNSAGYLEVQGLILCHMPVRLVEQRNTYYRRAIDNNEAFIDDNLNRVEEAGTPIQRDRRTKITTGRRAVEPQGD